VLEVRAGFTGFGVILTEISMGGGGARRGRAMRNEEKIGTRKKRSLLLTRIP